MRERPPSRICDGGVSAEWRGLRVVDRQLIGEGQDVKDPEASANGGPAVVKGVPGKADPRLKVFKGRVRCKVKFVKGRAGSDCTDAGVSEKSRHVRNLVLGLSRNGCHFVA